MIPYILLIFIPCIFLFFAIKETEKNKRVLISGESTYIRQNSLAVPVFFFLYFLMLALRAESVGSDTIQYKRRFLAYPSLDLKGAFAEDTEPLYSLLNWVISRFTDDPQVFLAICSLIIIIPIAYVYSKDRNYSYTKIILFLNLTPFVMIFSGVRQSIAIAIGMIAYLFAKEKKLFKFLVMVAVAFCFHYSAFILLFLYPSYHASFKRKDLLFIIPIILTVYIFNEPIFNSLTNFLARFSDEYLDVEIMNTGAIGSLLLFIIFAVFCYVVPDEKKMDREAVGFRNLLLFAVVLQCFTPLHPLAMRMNYYYILFIPLAITKVLTIQSTATRQIAVWGTRIMGVLFLFLYLRKLLTAYSTGVSTLNTIPYVFFWN